MGGHAVQFHAHSGVRSRASGAGGPVAGSSRTRPANSSQVINPSIQLQSKHCITTSATTLHIHYTTHRSPRATARLPIAASSIQLTNPSSMSERPRRPELGGGAPRAARGAVKSSGMTSSSIHQQHHQQLHHSNFLRSQLTRRPTGAAASGASGASAAGGGSVASGSSAETLRVPGGGGVADVDVLSDTSEIVVRNQQGEIELGDPPTPVLEEHDEQAEDRQEAESAWTLRSPFSFVAKARGSARMRARETMFVDGC